MKKFKNIGKKYNVCHFLVSIIFIFWSSKFYSRMEHIQDKRGERNLIQNGIICAKARGRKYAEGNLKKFTGIIS